MLYTRWCFAHIGIHAIPIHTHIYMKLVSWKRLYPMANGVGSPASLDTTNPIKGMMVYCSTAPSITLPGAAKTF